MRYDLLLIAGMFIVSVGMPGCRDSGTGPGDCPAFFSPPREWLGGLSSETVQSVLRLDGTVWSWGPGYSGTLGHGYAVRSDTPVQALNLHDVLSIDQYMGAAVAVDKRGDVWFWGNVEAYRGPTDTDTNVLIPIPLARVEGTRSISLDLIKIHGLKLDGTVWTMTLDPDAPRVLTGPTTVNGLCNVTYVDKLLAVTQDGRIYDLAHKSYVQDGLGHIVSAVGSLSRHVLALKSDSTVWAWGANDLGQLGDGTFEPRTTPVQVINLHQIVQISALADYNLALAADGSVWFWGFEGRQNGTLIGRHTPVRIGGIDNAVLVCAAHDCLVMKRDGTYWAFDVETKTPIEITLPQSIQKDLSLTGN